MMSDWVCEFCFKPCDGALPDSWEFVFQSAVCPDCQKKVASDGGYLVVKGGAYAFAKDPRSNKPWGFAAVTLDGGHELFRTREFAESLVDAGMRNLSKGRPLIELFTR